MEEKGSKLLQGNAFCSIPTATWSDSYQGAFHSYKRSTRVAVITVESAVKYCFVWKGMQTRRKGQNKAEGTPDSKMD